MLLDRVIHFGEALGDQVKCRSPKKLKSLIEVHNLFHVSDLVRIFIIVRRSSAERVHTARYAVPEKYIVRGKILRRR